jgi:hypothetical protein
MTDQPRDPNTRERKTDTRWSRFVETRAYRDIWLLIITGLVLAALLQDDARDRREAVRERRAAAEIVERRDQTCKLFERAANEAVIRVQRTYMYLDGLSPRERRQPLNRAILAQLPENERVARTQRAPAYCHKPGVGLDTPPLPVPKRPASLLVSP